MLSFKCEYAIFKTKSQVVRITDKRLFRDSEEKNLMSIDFN